MKIIATSDWHLGNMFHGNDRLPEHKHFLSWLLSQLEEQKPDALLIAGDVFDNGNPSAASQAAYYGFLADASERCPSMQIVIIAGNHDSANRLEAPRALLTRHHVEVRGVIKRDWVQTGDQGEWQTDYDDLMLPITSSDGEQVVILAVPYLRNDIIQSGDSYSKGVNQFLRELTSQARSKYPDTPLVMMAHMYASGADIATKDASEKIIIGGVEEVSMEIIREILEYEPQHKLVILPKDDEELTPAKLKKLIDTELVDRVDGKLDDHFAYVMLKVKLEKVSNDNLMALEEFIAGKNAVLCKIQRIIPELDLSTISGAEQLHSIDDILNRDPLETLKEAFAIQNKNKMSEHQEQMLSELLRSITSESDNT